MKTIMFGILFIVSSSLIACTESEKVEETSTIISPGKSDYIYSNRPMKMVECNSYDNQIAVWGIVKKDTTNQEFYWEIRVEGTIAENKFAGMFHSRVIGQGETPYTKITKIEVDNQLAPNTLTVKDQQGHKMDFAFTGFQYTRPQHFNDGGESRNDLTISLQVKDPDTNPALGELVYKQSCGLLRVPIANIPFR